LEKAFDGVSPETWSVFTNVKEINYWFSLAWGMTISRCTLVKRIDYLILDEFRKSGFPLLRFLCQTAAGVVADYRKVPSWLEKKFHTCYYQY
jgi:hypothetical protein